jgi:putative protease
MEKLIGKVIHYYPKVKAAIVELKGSLKIGDRIKLKKGEKEFEQEVTSIQIEHKPIKRAKKGDKIGLLVIEPVKEGFEVYKIS